MSDTTTPNLSAAQVAAVRAIVAHGTNPFSPDLLDPVPSAWTLKKLRQGGLIARAEERGFWTYDAEACAALIGATTEDPGDVAARVRQQADDDLPGEIDPVAQAAVAAAEDAGAEAAGGTLVSIGDVLTYLSLGTRSIRDLQDATGAPEGKSGFDATWRRVKRFVGIGLVAKVPDARPVSYCLVDGVDLGGETVTIGGRTLRRDDPFIGRRTSAAQPRERRPSQTQRIADLEAEVAVLRVALVGAGLLDAAADAA